MDHYQFIQHFFSLGPGALDAPCLKNQADSVKIIDKLRGDSLINIQSLLIFRRYLNIVFTVFAILL